MKYFTREVKIGLAGILALSVLFLGINFLKGINLFKPSNFYYVEFSDIKGLAKSSPVYVDGYNIGVVSNILYNYSAPGHVLVEIKVDDELRIPKGSSAELISEMLGGCTMNLLMANNPRERYQPGDTIQGSAHMGLMDKAEVLVPQVEQMMGKIDTLLTTLNKLAADPNLPAIMQNTKEITENLNTSTSKLNLLLANDVPQLTHKLNKVGDNVILLTDNLNKLDLQSTLSKVDTTMFHVQTLATKLNSKNNNIGLLLNDTALYYNLNHTIGSANSLLLDLKNHPKRYVHFSIFGKKDK